MTGILNRVVEGLILWYRFKISPRKDIDAPITLLMEKALVLTGRCLLLKVKAR